MHPQVDVGTGAPVVLLHGQTGSHGDWFRVVPLLAEDHRVIAVDRPGYRGNPDEAADFGGNAEQLAKLITSMGLSPVVVVAHSWAGGVALELALRRPELVAHLVLLSSVGHADAIRPIDRIFARRLLMRASSFLANRAGARLGRFVEWGAGSRLDAEARTAVRDGLIAKRDSRAWETSAIELVTLIRDTPDLQRRLGEVQTPTTVLHGHRDPVVPLRAGAALVAAMPHARMLTLRAGHLLPLECPQLIADAVREVARPVRSRAVKCGAGAGP